jgi:hypothetical protein
VAIPDSNFGKWLDTAGYHSCLSGNSTIGWQLDTTCSAVHTDTMIDCSIPDIADLTGIQYFTHLRYLYCSTNILSILPLVTSSLTYLECYNNCLSSLPAQPPSLTYLECHSIQLISLPALPASLSNLTCYSNQLSSLSALPASLSWLI